jgi:type I restriction enzyme S subunit
LSRQIKRLGDVAEFIRGITFKPEDVVGADEQGAVVCMRTKNIQKILEVNDVIAVPYAFIRRDELFLRKGDILISSANSWNLVGKVAQVPELPYRATAGGFIAIVRAKQGEIDSEYLYRWLASDSVQATIRACGRQTTNISNLSVPRFLDLSIVVPEQHDQERISKILDKTDSLRSKRQKAIRITDEFLRAVFIDMFGALDSQSHVPVSFSDIADLDAPMVDPTNDKYADLLHVGPDRIEKGNGQLLECETARAEGLISKKFVFDERYVLYSKIRPALKKCALAEFRGLCSADMYPVRPIEGKVTREFIWGLLLSDVFDRYVNTLPDRANIPKLNRTELNAFNFRLPPINLQSKYSDIVRSTMKLKRKHQTFLAEANSLPASLQYFN